MKKIYTLFFLFSFMVVHSQTITNEDSTRTPVKGYGKNIIKVNLSSILLNNYNITYERQVGKHVSISLGYRYMVNGDLPYQAQIKDNLKFDNIDIGNFKMGGYALTPEIRFYLSSKHIMKGFYIAPYARYSNFDVTAPVTYTTSVIVPPNPVPQSFSKTAPFTGNITAFSGGIMLGMQYNLGKHAVIDIWLIGAHYGSSNGDARATFSPALSATPPAPGYDSEQQSLQKAINNIKADPFTVTGKVDPSGTFATLNSTGPWVGIRALGINLGIRF
jgi:hypothetical protein